MSQPPASKMRLDQLLVERELAESRNKAQSMIMSGAVIVNEERVDKAGTLVKVDSQIRIKQISSKYVSRGGEKIEGMFSLFGISCANAIALDIGASTGGFTDFMLGQGASKVYAVDVGTNQLNSRLKGDLRVVCMEQTNAKDLTPEMFEPRPHLCTIDVSFISLRKVLAPVCAVLAEPYSLIVLVKPQFELGREFIGKGGVVKETALHEKAVTLVSEFAKELGLSVIGSHPSPLKGEKKGNQEYFLGLERK